MKPRCDCCGEELIEFGALYFGVPEKDGRVVKKHICAKCKPRFEVLFQSVSAA
jgi:hypothetical protein